MHAKHYLCKVLLVFLLVLLVGFWLFLRGLALTFQLSQLLCLCLLICNIVETVNKSVELR